MPKPINVISFFLPLAETPEELAKAQYIASLLRQAGPVIISMTAEIDALRSEREALRLRCRKEARHKCFWMAAACLLAMWILWR